MAGRLNLYSPEVWFNPYPHFAELRRSAPVSQIDPGGMWAVTRHDDAVYVLKNPQLFSSEGLRAALQPAWLERRNPLMDSLVLLDPPKHTRLRALVNRTFTAPSVNRLESLIRSAAETLTVRMLEQRTVDFIPAFAMPLPARAIGGILGLEASQVSFYREWSETLVSIGPTDPDDHARHAQIVAMLNAMERYMSNVLDSRRSEPKDDLLSDLLQATVEGERLSNVDLLSFFSLLLVAGMETTQHLLSHSALLLAERPELMDRLRADRSLIPRFIDEILRLEPPVVVTMRTTTQEVEVSGVRLPQGAVVAVLFASTNRDEKYYPNGDHFDLDRAPSTPSLSFGHGIHYCLGAPLARLEGRVGLEVLLERCSRLTRKPELVQWALAGTTRGPASLPVELHPA